MNVIGSRDFVVVAKFLSTLQNLYLCYHEESNSELFVYVIQHVNLMRAHGLN